MHISIKTGYALRALAELALNSSSKPVSIAEISRKQRLPRKYTEQLFRKLKKNQLIKSIHGAKGGYLLNKEIADISLKDIMQAVDDDFNNSFCEGNTFHTEHCTGLPCKFNTFWDDVKNNINSYLDSIKLDQVISKI